MNIKKTEKYKGMFYLISFVAPSIWHVLEVQKMYVEGRRGGGGREGEGGKEAGKEREGRRGAGGREGREEGGKEEGRRQGEEGGREEIKETGKGGREGRGGTTRREGDRERERGQGRKGGRHVPDLITSRLGDPNPQFTIGRFPSTASVSCFLSAPGPGWPERK